MTDLLSFTRPAHRDFRPYTRSGVFKTKLSPAQIRLLEEAGHGGVITTADCTNWLTLRSMVEKGAAEIISQDVRHMRNGLVVRGKINAVRVK